MDGPKFELGQISYVVGEEDFVDLTAGQGLHLILITGTAKVKFHLRILIYVSQKSAARRNFNFPTYSSVSCITPPPRRLCKSSWVEHCILIYLK